MNANMKTCANCGSPIPSTRRSNAKYCSEHCQRRAGLTSEVRNKIVERGKRKSKRHPGLLSAFETKCAICGWSIPQWRPGYEHCEHSGGCEVHHIVPISQGGTEESRNLILLCPNCHKMAHVGLITKEELSLYTKTDEEITKASEERRLKVCAEYLLDNAF